MFINLHCVYLYVHIEKCIIDCTIIVLLLYYYCTMSVLLLYYYCIIECTRKVLLSKIRKYNYRHKSPFKEIWAFCNLCVN